MTASANERRRRTYAKQAARYDTSAARWERWVFGDEHRAWACSEAVGNTLEVAIGTGLNLPHYPAHVRLTGIDLTEEMLARSRIRAAELGREVHLREADAQNLPFADGTFDTVVCTYALCSIPDDARAVAEMARVLVPGGRLILVDHIASTVRPLYWLQRLYDGLLALSSGDSATRRPLLHVIAAGFELLRHDRLRAGVIERCVAVKPS